MKRIRTYNEVSDGDRSDLLGQVTAQRERVNARLASVRHVVAVVSGKGGVGKSLVTAGLSAALARLGRRVGLVDADLHGPTAARMLGVRAGGLVVREHEVEPALAACGVRVMSSDLLLEEHAPLAWREPGHERFVWRGALAAGMLREFLADVAWGALDVLLVDMPPGSERLDTLAELVPGLAGAVVVTIPSEASYRAVRRAVEAARAARIPILGIVENMAGYRCGSCEATGPLFPGDAGERLARDASAPLLARVPFDPALAAAVDCGEPEGAANLLGSVAESLLGGLDAAAEARA
ncbi:MAG TPA: P-loop NTPase [Vicinamibacteria bacterium]|jgi:ATP-binding protein involved in chromosome partitioning